MINIRYFSVIRFNEKQGFNYNKYTKRDGIDLELLNYIHLIYSDIFSNIRFEQRHLGHLNCSSLTDSKQSGCWSSE